MLLNIVAITNAILWGGVITYLLFRFLSGTRDLEDRLAELESKVSTPPE